MKLGKWIDSKMEIMHVTLFYSSNMNFGCYGNLNLHFHWLIMKEIVDPGYKLLGLSS